jgi:ABC-2 type transport system ATP-binding protein
MTAIRLENLTRTFGDIVAVDGLTLTVEEGEVFGFLGPNGAGKSTTIDVLLGFLEPTAGTATVLGRDVTADSRAVRRRVGLLPEGYGMYENLTGRELLESAIETKRADDDPDAIVERVGLDPDDARRPVGDYSTGMRQRLALGTALVGEPDLLVLDEPSAGLDPEGIKRLRRIVRAEAERGATVFFSSHALDEVERVCDRVAILHEGSLVALNSVESLRADLDVSAVVSATVSEVPADLDVARVEGVTDVAVDGNVVRITCAESAAKMRALRRLDEQTAVVDIAVEEPSLESLFEEYVGDDARAAGEREAVASAAATGGEGA